MKLTSPVNIPHFEDFYSNVRIAKKSLNQDVIKVNLNLLENRKKGIHISPKRLFRAEVSISEIVNPYINFQKQDDAEVIDAGSKPVVTGPFQTQVQSEIH